MQISSENFLKRIIELIRDGDTQLAMQELEQLLESDGKYHELHRWLITLSNRYNQVEKDARRGLVEADSLHVLRNKTNDSLLKMIRQIQEGDLKVDPTEMPASSSKNRWLIPLITILALTAVGFFGIRGFGGSGEAACPDFVSDSEFNLMLFPFREIGGGEALNPEIAIMDKLDELCRANGIQSSIRIHAPFKTSLDYQTATEEGNKCNASMVVWGTVEQHSDLMDLTTRYKYLGEAEGLEVTKLQLEGETQVDTSTSISSIVRQGVLTKNIEELILTVFGLIAHQEEKYDVAVDALEKAASQDTSGAILTGVILADAYLAIGNSSKALGAYDRVLEVHPEYKLALNNRAVLEFLNGEFEKSALDYSRIIQMDPQNIEALSGRIAANTKLEKMEEVQVDMDALQRLNPRRFRRLKSAVLILNQPKLFKDPDVFLPIASSAEVTYSKKQLQDAQQLVFAGSIKDGKRSTTHLLNMESANGTYEFKFAVSGETQIKKTIVFPDGKETVIKGSEDKKTLVLKKGKYKLIIERANTAGKLYFEGGVAPGRLVINSLTY